MAIKYLNHVTSTDYKQPADKSSDFRKFLLMATW